MRLGLFPGQLEALRELARKGLDAEKRSRRQFFVAVAATIGVGTGAFFAGRAVGHAAGKAEAEREIPPGDARARWRSKLEWAEEFATQPIEVLLERRSTFLMTIEQTGGSEAAWKGFARLAEHALRSPTPDRDLLLRLSEVVRVAPPPDALGSVVERILEATRR